MTLGQHITQPGANHPFALVERRNLRAGQSVLVQGTGGVAIFALQIAKSTRCRGFT